MKQSEIENLQSDLVRLYECIVISIEVRDWLTSVDVKINDIWDSTGERIRPDLDERTVEKVIVCDGVEEFRFGGDLVWRGLLDSPSEIGWSHAELESLSVIQQENGRLRLTATLGGARRLDVECRSISLQPIGSE